jgi:hypothetical protein
MIHKDYCSRCKIRKGPFIKYCKRLLKSGDESVQYYLCRPCNNWKAKRHYDKYKGVAQKRNIKNMNAKYPEKLFARQKVAYAIKTGVIVKPSLCEHCGRSRRTEGHHMDYEKPLEVIWLCTSCHADYHSKRG